MTDLTIHPPLPSEEIAEGQIPAITLIDNLYDVADALTTTEFERSVYVSAFTAGMLLGSQRPEQILEFFKEIVLADDSGALLSYQDIVDNVYSK